MIIKNRKTDYNHMNNQKQYNISTNTSVINYRNFKFIRIKYICMIIILISKFILIQIKFLFF